MIVKKQSKARVFQLSRSLKSLGRSVGRKNRSGIERQVVKDSRIRKKVIECMGKLMSQELTNLASLKTNSMLRNRSCEALEHFSWKDFLVALKKKHPLPSPCLSSVFMSRDEFTTPTVKVEVVVVLQMKKQLSECALRF